MRAIHVGLLALLAVPAALAQAPVEDLTSREQAIQRGQQKAGAAYRELQQAQYEAKLAEQDYLNAQDAQRAAQKQADEMKRQRDAAKQALDAAQRKVAQARKRYEEALTVTDKAFQTPPAK
ncbi:MAG: hypothetical protein HYY78_08505 [Betaproteobacteria bacterium]|nr:hypothetical protein [Betaproteobacteria bacterium]